MKQNVGGFDRFIRVVVGVLALASIPFCDSPYKWFALLGVPVLISGMLGTCFAYTLCGFSTCKVDPGAHH